MLLSDPHITRYVGQSMAGIKIIKSNIPVKVEIKSYTQEIFIKEMGNIINCNSYSVYLAISRTNGTRTHQ